MSKYKISLNIAGIVFLMAITNCSENIREFSSENSFAKIFPDYAGIVIPPNIAPLNFYIKEKGSEFHVEIYSKNGDKLVFQQHSPSIQIPIKKWHEFLKQNTGNNFFIDIYSKKGKWVKYKTISDSIASEPIESYLAYRLVGNARSYTYWKKLGIYQRDLENFDEFPIYINTSAKHGCVNCHSFCKADPQKMSLHFRAVEPGTMIMDGNKLEKLTTKTKYTLSSFVYPAWHPSGNYVAYSLNKINVFSKNYISKNVVSELADFASDIVVYNIKSNTIITSPKICTKSRENLPTWSPDGKWLYFISAPEAKKNNFYTVIMGRYSLLRISFDTATNKFGNVDTVLSSKRTGMSISFPLISPNGRYVLFCMIDHGYFAVFDKLSDLYILDLESNKYHKLNINSNSTESYHVWSQNGKWIEFSSKRLDDIYSVPFFTYFDNNGNTYKPFVLPQKNPLFYNTLLQNFNRPELVKGKINLNPRQTRDFLYSEPENVIFDSLNYESYHD